MLRESLGQQLSVSTIVACLQVVLPLNGDVSRQLHTFPISFHCMDELRKDLELYTKPLSTHLDAADSLCLCNKL